MNKRINNKGFTLVELLAVFVILISVSLVAVGGITASLDKREEKEFEEQKELAIDVAKIYFSLEGGTCVSIQKLIDENYFSGNNKISELEEYKEYTVKLDLENYTYVFSDSSC